jgi:hypothetical protein
MLHVSGMGIDVWGYNNNNINLNINISKGMR